MEDVFTLNHQNLLACVSALNLNQISQDQITLSGLPGVFKKAITKAADCLDREDEGKSSLACRSGWVGLKADENGVVVQYNIPLRNHSAWFQIVSDKTIAGLVLQLEFFGFSSFYRWDNVVDFARFLDASGVMTLTNTPKLNNFGVKISVITNNKDQVPIVLEVFSEMSLMIENEYAKNRVDNFFRRFKEKNLGNVVAVAREALCNRCESLFTVPFYGELLQQVGGETGLSFADRLWMNIYGPKERREKLCRLLTELVQSEEGDSEKCEELKREFHLVIPPENWLNTMIMAARAGVFLKVGVFFNPCTDSSAQNLWEALLDKGQGVDEAIETAKTGMSGNIEVINASFRLWKALFERGRGYKEAIETVKECLLSEDNHCGPKLLYLIVEIANIVGKYSR